MERFIRNGDFDNEIDNGKFVIKMFLIKHKLKIRKLFDFKCILINKA